MTFRRVACSFLSLVLVLLLQVSASAQIDPYNTVINNGASSNRVDMIFIGDGYTSSQISTDYVNHIQGTLNHFFHSALGSPLGRYSSFFNVHRVNVISNESGADKPPQGIFVDTALDASYWWGGTERCLYFNTTKANNAVAAALGGTGIDTDDGMLLGTVNDSKYGGCGGQWGVYAGANAAAKEIALHEIGHSFARLADEYFYTDDHYDGPEPSQWNVTTDPDLGKWDRWLGYDDPETDIGPIDYYEGGRYHATGIYRPSDNSKMRALNRPFDAISREKFIHDIYLEVDPLDDWYDDSLGFDTTPDSLWVDTVDPDVINVEWFVDGESIGVLGEVLDLKSLNLSRGEHEIMALAYDSILDFAFTDLPLDWWRLAPTLLQQSVSWTVFTIPEPSSLLFASSVLLLVGTRRCRLRSQK